MIKNTNDHEIAYSDKNIFASMSQSETEYTLKIENDLTGKNTTVKLALNQKAMMKQYTIQVMNAYWKMGYDYIFNNYSDIVFPCPVIRI